MNPESNPTLGALDCSGHLVHFYEDVAALADLVSGFIRRGLEAGEPVVVVATDAHRQAFTERLLVTGVDVGGAVTSDQLLFMDAHEALARFMIDGMPDQGLFRRHVGGLIADSATSHGNRQVRTYGEMVDVLWREGNSRAALRLEEMWNDLLEESSVSLLCAYSMASFYKELAALPDVCDRHGHVILGRRGPAAASAPAALLQEIDRRQQIENALGSTIRGLRSAEADLIRSQENLRDLVENGSIGMHWVGPDGTILWANRAELDMLGYTEEEYLGRNCAEFHVDQDVITDILRRLHADEVLRNREARIRAKDGSIRHVLISSSVRRRDGQFLHTRCFTQDVTDLKLAEDDRKAAARRTEHLVRITSAIAAAVTPDEVFAALVDQVAEQVKASSASLWLLSDDGRELRQMRVLGFPEAARRRYAAIPLDTEERSPALDAFLGRKPLWIESQERMFAEYPHIARVATPGRSYRISCLPIGSDERVLGVLGFTIEGFPPTQDEQNFLMIVAGYSAQALERLRMLETEQKIRAQAELLYGLARSVIQAEDVDEVIAAALDGIQRAVGADRAAILTFDENGVMRFKAWRGLSDGYRHAVEGHSPWPREVRSPAPILVGNVEADPAWADYRSLFRSEGIAALGFIPLVAGGTLIGKFMVYFAQPREVRPAELEIALAVANHVAAAIARFSALAELRNTVRFNELFTGMLGHDLRNPLGAIITAAQLIARQRNDERTEKLVSRLLSSGDRMARMIDQLLDFTRVRLGGGIPVSCRPADLLPLLGQVVQELEGGASPHGVRLRHTGLTSGVWDADRLYQVFSNLVANAIRHGESDHGVDVHIDGSHPDAARITVYNKGEIPTELLPKLFEPMASGDRRRENSAGLGLGLYISREILKAHGGDIEVRSSEADGTTVVVSLPRVGASAPGRTS